MHPMHHAVRNADKPACILAETGETLSYRQLDDASNQGAQLLRSLGLARGDVIAVMMENELAVLEIAWAAQRSGLYLTSISTRLSTPDAAYILRDADAKLLVVSDRLAPLAREILSEVSGVLGFTVSEPVEDLSAWHARASQFPATPIADQSPGTDMLYSSGTTGRPKGVKPALPEGSLDEPTPTVGMGRQLYGMDEDTVYLSTSPLYHAAPLRWAMTVQRIGGTVVIMSKFDAEAALRYIEQYRITHATWVPTHFIRMLKLPAEVRERYDHASLVAMVHAAAPCPVPVKRAMIDWWGPVVHEYYSGTEQCGITALSSEEWQRKPGSVGRPILGSVKILDGNGDELPPGEIGDVYFADGPRFEYHNDPDKTAQAYNDRGWATLGDIGYLDEDGFLFLTDRKNFMIISGGVNIYPQEIESALITHPKVDDVAVVGVPDDELGEVAIAIVQPVLGEEGGETLAEELRAFARATLGGVKTPKRFEFRSALPREATGKLFKGKLIDEMKRAETTP